MKQIYKSLRSLAAIAAMSLSATAFGQTIAPGYYYVKANDLSTNPGAYMRTTSQDLIQISSTAPAATPSLSDKPYIWQVESKGEGQISVRNIWNNRYLGGQNGTYAHHGTSDDTEHILTVSDPSGNGSFRLDIADMKLDNQYGNSLRPGGGGENVFVWICTMYGGDVSLWQFEPVDQELAEALEAQYPDYTGVDVEEGIYYVKADAGNTSKPNYYLYANTDDRVRTYQAANENLSQTELTEEMVPYMYKVSKGALGYSLQNLLNGRYVGGTPNTNGHHVGATAAPAYMKLESTGEGIYRILDENQPINGFLPAYLNSGNEAFGWWAASADWLTGSINWNLIRVTAPTTLTDGVLTIKGYVNQELIADAVARQKGADIQTIVLTFATLAGDITAENIRGGLDQGVPVYVSEEAAVTGENIFVGDKTTALSEVKAEKAQTIYGIDGKRLSATGKGVNIIRTNGSVRKVLK